jgi:hypothetical protein
MKGGIELDPQNFNLDSKLYSNIWNGSKVNKPPRIYPVLEGHLYIVVEWNSS